MGAVGRILSSASASLRKHEQGRHNGEGLRDKLSGSCDLEYLLPPLLSTLRTTFRNSCLFLDLQAYTRFMNSPLLDVLLSKGPHVSLHIKQYPAPLFLARVLCYKLSAYNVVFSILHDHHRLWTRQPV